MRTEVRRLLATFQYFTRLPMPSWVGHSSVQLAGTTRYLPIVGIAVGSAAAVCVWASAKVFPLPLAVILSTVVTVMLTGAFHEDGLADTLDGLGGGSSRERALEIMKDPRIGTHGAVALILALSTKVAALAALPVLQAAAALIAGHALSRWCAVLIIWRLPYARLDSSTRAKPVVERMAPIELALASAFAIAPLAVCGIPGAVGALAALIVCTGLCRWYSKRLGGYTGDTLGATQQLTEIAFYLGWLAAWNSF